MNVNIVRIGRPREAGRSSNTTNSARKELASTAGFDVNKSFDAIAESAERIVAATRSDEIEPPLGHLLAIAIGARPAQDEAVPVDFEVLFLRDVGDDGVHRGNLKLEHFMA